MKYLLILLLFAACAAPVPHNSYSTITGYDFSEYAEKGFLITPEAYTENHESMGIITVTVWPGVRKAQNEFSTAPGYRTVKTGSSGYWFVEELKSEDAIRNAYLQAKSMEADAIIRFDIKNVERFNGSLREPGIEIYGYAIKRK